MAKHKHQDTDRHPEEESRTERPIDERQEAERIEDQREAHEAAERVERAHAAAEAAAPNPSGLLTLLGNFVAQVRLSKVLHSAGDEAALALEKAIADMTPPVPVYGSGPMTPPAETQADDEAVNA